MEASSSRSSCRSTRPVLALTSWDDGSGQALYAGGWFSISPAGDSYLAKWVCRPKTTAKQRKL